MSESANSIDLIALHQEIADALRQAELKAAELRGQLQLIERLIRHTQQQEREIIHSGDKLGEQHP